MKDLGILESLNHSIAGDGRSVLYHFSTKGAEIGLNPLIGSEVKLEFSGNIRCIACQRSITKTFQNGYCFPCVKALPETDLCNVKPELCHFAKGTCRDPEWGEDRCFIPHTIYLALSSNIKVGITRSYRVVSRWVEQGAVQALPIAQVFSRKDAGAIEVALKEHVMDKTDWRAMLKGHHPQGIDLRQKRDELYEYFPQDVKHIKLKKESVREFAYPVQNHPTKVVSLNLDKTPSVSDRLLGLKGRYLIFESGVLNFNKFSGYELNFSV